MSRHGWARRGTVACSSCEAGQEERRSASNADPSHPAAHTRRFHEGIFAPSDGECDDARVAVRAIAACWWHLRSSETQSMATGRH
jgi:hypothetical protein